MHKIFTAQVYETAAKSCTWSLTASYLGESVTTELHYRAIIK